ncbi:Golgi apparatus membrane protein tvp38 [Amylocarpus encephaloides]|uniref:Golgi apparatus membrane protein TVP38 n=1 Tax=Amylocarpus encephaloides TaxID=45428 RepID=A0A9P8C6I1_9HELO|nr:Golgi apparatus membrane protein tvp38 [Amylocarpus encephaloides]
MPADYSSTAKALALPISPSPSPSLERNTVHPPWTRRLSSGTRRPVGSSPYSQQTRATSLSQQVIHTASKAGKRVVKAFQSLSIIQKTIAVVVGLIFFVLSILFLVYNERIFHAFAPYAKKWRDTTGGWTILWIITFFCAFPPVIGYSTSITIAGFVYGFPNGWFIVSTATVAGSLASFMTSRTIFSSYVNRLVGQDKRFEALALTLKHDGIKILCMIRLCPLPYSLSNAAMSTFPTVHPLSFAAATAITSPKLLIHVFMGSRLAIIAETGKQMSSSTKAINYASIILGGSLGVALGYYIYNRTLKRAKELEIEELEAGRGEGSVVVPPPRVFTDMDGEDADAAALMNDDDISLWDNEDGFEHSGRREPDSPGYRDEFTDDEDVFACGDLEGPPKRKGSE